MDEQRQHEQQDHDEKEAEMEFSATEEVVLLDGDVDNEMPLPSLKDLLEDMGNQAWLSVPIAAMNISFASRLALASATTQSPAECLALAFANLTGYSVLLGLSQGMEPMCSQLIAAGRPDLAAQTLVKGILLAFAACACVSILWISPVPAAALRCIGLNSDVAAGATMILQSLLPDLFMQAVAQPLKVFVASQRHSLLSTASLCIGLGLAGFGHASMSLVLGTEASLTFTGFNLVVVMLASCWKLRLIKPSTCLQRPATWKWRSLLNLCMATLGSTVAQTWCYSLVAVASTALGQSTAAVTVLNLDLLPYLLQSTVSSCASISSGYQLGAGPYKVIYHSSLLGSIILGLVGAGWWQWWWKLLDSYEVSRTSRVAMQIIELGGFLQAGTSGILRGTGRPEADTLATCVLMGMVGTLLGLVLAIVFRLGLEGLLGGLCFGVYASSSVNLALIVRTHWRSLAQSSVVRLRSCWIDEDGEILPSGEAAVASSSESEEDDDDESMIH